MKHLLLLLTAALLPLTSSAQKFNVTPSDDLSSTVEQVVSYSRSHPGTQVTVLLADGAYTLSSPIHLEGLGGPFRLAAASHAHPLIQGDVDISGWTLSDLRPGVVEAPLPEGIDLGVPVGDTNRIDFYADGVRQILARWPNDQSFIHAGQCIHPESGETLTESPQGILQYTDAELTRWADESEPCVHGYWRFDWYESSKAVTAIDTLLHTFTVSPIGDAYGYRAGCRFYGFNLLSELDVPGEYYIDRQARKIYWMAPEGFLAHPVTTRISVYDGAVMISAEGCDDVTIQGLELRGGRGTAITINNSSRCSIKDCHIHCFADNALNITGGHDNKVKGCTIGQLGRSGMQLKGGDRPTLTSARLEISHCRIHDFALYKHTYCPAVFFYGVGAHIHHCEMYNAGSSAMRVEGNDILIERNYFHDLVRESDDQGGVESFGDQSYRRIVIRHNRFCDINGGTECGAAAVRFDDLISGNEVYRNTFTRCGSHNFGAVQIHGGRDNRIHHNTFIDCNSPISHNAWNWDAYQSKLNDFSGRWRDIDLYGPLYTARYPELRIPTDSTNNNANYFYHNRSIRCGAPLHADQVIMKSNKTINK